MATLPWCIIFSDHEQQLIRSDLLMFHFLWHKVTLWSRDHLKTRSNTRCLNFVRSGASWTDQLIRASLNIHSDDLDVQQMYVSQNLQLRDPLQVLDSVFVVQLVEPVDGHSELLRVTQDDDLHTKHNIIIIICNPKNKRTIEYFKPWNCLFSDLCENI